ncbi:MAG: hypothetical protein ACI37R_03640, partial [Candidatus Avigastranaerophilus sp.]
MSKKDTLTEEDLFKSSIPIINPNGQIADGNTVEVKPANVLVSYFQDNPIMSYSISFALIIVILKPITFGTPPDFVITTLSS